MAAGREGLDIPEDMSREEDRRYLIRFPEPQGFDEHEESYEELSREWVAGPSSARTGYG